MMGRITRDGKEWDHLNGWVAEIVTWVMTQN